MPTQHAYADDNYRIIGVADMAQAIRDGRPHRASGALAYHVLEVMLAFQTSSDAGVSVGDPKPSRAAGDAAEAQDRRPARLRRRRIAGNNGGNSDARSLDRLGWMERTRARKGGPYPQRNARGGRLQGLYRKYHRGLRRSRNSRHEPDRSDLHDVEDRKGRGGEPDRRGSRRRRPRRLSRRHVRRVPRLRRISVHVRRPMGRPSRQHHRLPRRHLGCPTTPSCRG